MDSQIFLWGILGLFSATMLVFVIVLFKVLKFDKQKNEATLIMTPGYMAEIEKQTREKFDHLIDESVISLESQLEQKINTYLNSLEHGLKDPDAQINLTVHQLLSGELEKYQHDLKDAREKLFSTINQIDSEIALDQQQAKRQIEDYIEKEKAQRLAKINDKLTDILAQYLAASLGSDIDFTTQRDYIYRRLEENKEQLKRDIINAS